MPIKDKAKRAAWERAHRAKLRANPVWQICSKCGGRRIVGLHCRQCQRDYQFTPKGRAVRKRAMRKYNTKCAENMVDSYMRLVLRHRWPLAPEMMNLAKLALRLKRAAKLTNLGRKQETK